MVYLIYPNTDIWEYMVQGIDDNEVVCKPLNSNCNILQLVFRKLFKNQKLIGCMLLGKKIRKELKSLGVGDTVLITDYVDICLFKTIASIIKPKVKKCLWIWNPVKEDERERMCRVYDTIKRSGFEISTFDKNDAECYNNKFYNQFYRMNQTFSNAKVDYDFYFIGLEKNRGKILGDLHNQLKGFRCCFKVIRNHSEYIPYTENVENIKRASCIIEIVQEGQTGMTLRPLESLAYRKKLISNNKSLRYLDFYNKNNVFILGLDDMTKIDEFMNSPYIPIDEEVIQKYDVLTWIGNFKNSI